MACCDEAETCPLQHQAASESQFATSVSQAQADACCALSAGHESVTPTSKLALSASLAPVTSPLPVALVADPSPREDWRTSVPLTRPPIPKHVLLSVFLV